MCIPLVRLAFPTITLRNIPDTRKHTASPDRRNPYRFSAFGAYRYTLVRDNVRRNTATCLAVISLMACWSLEDSP